MRCVACCSPLPSPPSRSPSPVKFGRAQVQLPQQALEGALKAWEALLGSVGSPAVAEAPEMVLCGWCSFLSNRMKVS